MSEIQDAQAEQLEWAARNFPREAGPDKLHIPALGVAEEAGELCHEILKLNQGIRGKSADHIEKAIDAVGDITIYLFDLCNRLGVDFEQVVLNTWEEVKKRDWIKYPINGRTE